MVASKSVREAAVSRIFAKYLAKETWRSPFKVKLCENSKNSFFPKRALRVSLPFVLRVSFIFLQGYGKVSIIMGEKLWRIEIVYFLPSCLRDLNHNYLLFAKKVRDINCRPKGRQRLLSARVSMWTESHKIWKVWSLINHALSQCFLSYRLWLNK